MAKSSSVKGFQCQFIDSVPEDFHCKLCTLVARKLSFTSCCGESFCNACILIIQHNNKPCPECNTEDFKISEQVKYQRKMSSFQVYCLLKDKGCGWSGKLDELDAHVDPENGECEYMDVTCHCDQKVQRKNLHEHLANECVKRDFVCPYCSFKAIYEIVANVHWPECSYYPLPCPNRCGVTCERPTMEDHMKICPLEEVECQFQHVGCEAKFVREEEEEHMREKSQTHLTMMATSLVKMKKGFQMLFLEQDQKMKVQEEKFDRERKALQEAITKYEERLTAQEARLEKMQEEEDKALKEQTRKYEERINAQEKTFKMEIAHQDKKMKGMAEKYEKKLRLQEEILLKQQEEVERERKRQEKNYDDVKNTSEKNNQALKEQLDTMKLEIGQYKEEWDKAAGKKVAENTRALEKLQSSYFTYREFTIQNFKIKKVDMFPPGGVTYIILYPRQHWKSPDMYTHFCGYKFYIDVTSEGIDDTQPWTRATISICALNGEFDSQLSWPVRAEFSIELINHYEKGENKKYVKTIEWRRKETKSFASLKYSALGQNNAQKTLFLKNDTLYFKISDIKILEPLGELEARPNARPWWSF